MKGFKKEKVIWAIYLPISIIVCYLFVKLGVWEKIFSLDYLLLLLLAIIISFYPIRLSDSVFSLVTGISLVSFVLFGIIPEIILTSVAVIVLLRRMGFRNKNHYLYGLNLLIVMFLSVLSAVSYQSTKSFLGKSSGLEADLLPLIVYITVYVFGNHFLYFLIEGRDMGKKRPVFITEQLTLTLLINYALLPFFYILIYLYFKMGSTGLQLGFIPVITFVIGLYFWAETERNNFYLKQVNEATRRLTEKLSYESAIDCFVHSLIQIFQAQSVYYYQVIDNEKMRLEKTYNQTNEKIEIDKELNWITNSFLAEIFRNHETISFHNANDYLDSFGDASNFTDKQTFIIPLYALQKNRGLILMVHPKNILTEKYIQPLIENFNQSFFNTLENVIRYEKLKESSYTDGLTNLPNFRAFLKEAKKIESNEKEAVYSIIVIDIDHFKEVNDRHGHEAGNDILEQLGLLLKRFEGPDCFIARYGGEEFVVLLKNYNLEKTFLLAEAVRQAIESHAFTASYSILENKETKLQITASLGTAIAPRDGDNIYDLIALADEAMYLGSKQNGRNKVTIYDRNL